MDLYLMSTNTPKDILKRYELNLIGVNLNLNSIIKSIREGSDGIVKYYNKYRSHEL